MVTIRETKIYSRWFAALRDRKARARIQTRIDRLQLGILGDVKPVGEGVSELRIDYGPGYRVYFVQRGQELVILLAGGDKARRIRILKRVGFGATYRRLLWHTKRLKLALMIR